MDYIVSADPSWIDVDVVWRFLSEESYWARGVPREIVGIGRLRPGKTANPRDRGIMSGQASRRYRMTEYAKLARQPLTMST
jgi:hypothetical protein